MSLLRIVEDASPREPVLIQALSGWVDAGGAGTGTAAFLAASSRVIAEFDPDALFDYRSNRPILDFLDGEVRDIQWPEITVSLTSAAGRDLLVLTGLEPDLRWREFSSSVLELAGRFGVTRLVSIGAIPAAVPHTLEVPVMMTASKKDLLEGERVPEGVLRVPSAAVSAVDHLFVARGMETVGFWAQVPHYVTDEYKPAILALVAKVTGHLGLDVELDELRVQADEQRVQLDKVVAARPEARSYVERLETIAAADVSSGDQIAAEVERFLREVDGDSPFDA